MGNVFANEKTEFNMRAKAILKNNAVEVKTQFNNLIVKPEEVNKLIYSNPSFLPTITAKVDGKVVFDLKANTFLAKDSIVKFKFKSFESANQIDFFARNNSGESLHKNFEIEHDGKGFKNGSFVNETGSNLKEIDIKAWEAVTVDEAIQAIYGTTKIHEIDSKEISRMSKGRGFHCLYFNDACTINHQLPVRVRIESKMDLNSIAIFSNSTARSLIAFIQMPGHSITDIHLPIKFEKDGVFFFVVEGKDKKLYRSSQHLIRIGLQFEDTDDPYSRMHYILEENLAIKKDR